jgi:hypothetical protein
MRGNLPSNLPENNPPPPPTTHEPGGGGGGVVEAVDREAEPDKASTELALEPTGAIRSARAPEGEGIEQKAVEAVLRAAGVSVAKARALARTVPLARAEALVADARRAGQSPGLLVHRLESGDEPQADGDNLRELADSEFAAKVKVISRAMRRLDEPLPPDWPPADNLRAGIRATWPTNTLAAERVDLPDELLDPGASPLRVLQALFKQARPALGTTPQAHKGLPSEIRPERNGTLPASGPAGMSSPPSTSTSPSGPPSGAASLRSQAELRRVGDVNT